MENTSTPALPWGAPPAEPDTTIQKGESDERLELSQVGLKFGDRIEVKWTIEPDESETEGEAVIRWWGATVKDKVEDAPNVYTLIYDTFEGFTEENARVIFISPHHLVHIDTEEDLVWRREGDTYDEDPEDEAMEEENEGDVVLTTQQLREVLTTPECSELAAAEQSMFNNLNPHQQRIVASGMREFMDKFSDYVREKQLREGSDVVITQDDVLEFKTLLSKK